MVGSLTTTINDCALTCKIEDLGLGQYALIDVIIVLFHAGAKESISGGTIDAALELSWLERQPLSSTIVLQQQRL
jgi:hypothetical protein